MKPLPPKGSHSDFSGLAANAFYQGSPYHKNRMSRLGAPKHRGPKDCATEEDVRRNATICPLVTDDELNRATDWVKSAIRAGQCGKIVDNNGFPREIWYKDETGQYWFGRQTAMGTGDPPRGGYKGWPISKKEWERKFGRGEMT